MPIIPGIKPFRKLSQLNMIPKTFKIDLPQELAGEAMKCQTDEEAESLGIEWCIHQCRELISLWCSQHSFLYRKCREQCEGSCKSNLLNSK